MNIAMKSIFSKPALGLCCKLKSKYVYQPFRQVLITPTYPVTSCRSYCDNSADTKKLPQLMEFPPIIWPSFILFIKNWMFSTFIIRPYFDPEFNLVEFIEASKQAVQVVSDALHKSDFQALEDLVEKDALASLKKAISKLSVSQRQLLAINKEDIFYAFPYQVGVMFNKDDDKRWVEITMCYHVLKGLQQMRESDEVPPISLGLSPEYQEKIFVLNYRFLREFTKGVQDSWWVNIVNHFQPHTLVQK